MRSPKVLCRASCTLSQASRVRPAVIQASTMICAQASGRSMSCLSISGICSSLRIRSAKSFSSHVALSKIRSARREPRILFSTTSSPINSKVNEPLELRTGATDGSIALRQAVVVVLIHTAWPFWYCIQVSRRSCDWRALELSSNNSVRRWRTVCATSFKTSVALPKNTSRALRAKALLACVVEGGSVATGGMRIVRYAYMGRFNIRKLYSQNTL